MTKQLEVIRNWGFVALIVLVVAAGVGALAAWIVSIFIGSWSLWVFGITAGLVTIVLGLIMWLLEGAYSGEEYEEY